MNNEGSRANSFKMNQSVIMEAREARKSIEGESRSYYIIPCKLVRLRFEIVISLKYNYLGPMHKTCLL